MDDYYDDLDDDGQFEHEQAAQNAVDHALDNAEIDDFRGVIAVPGEETDRFDVECSSLDELQSYLQELYENAWYSHVPFDGGEAVFEGDPAGYVDEQIGERDLESFFDVVRDPVDAEVIFKSRDFVEESVKSKVLRVELSDINARLIRYFVDHPEEMRNLDPRKFEELIASLFREREYHVELTPRTKDGGLDILAIEKKDVGSALTLIECKRYGETKKVGVEIVRGLYGVVEQKRATRGILATTSYFTKGAKAFRDDVKYRIALADFDDLTRFVKEWSVRRRR